MPAERVNSLGRACAPSSPTPCARETPPPSPRSLPILEAITDPPHRLQTMLPKLHAILHGDRNPALAADPALEYDDAAELLLLLETL